MARDGRVRGDRSLAVCRLTLAVGRRSSSVAGGIDSVAGVSAVGVD